MILPFWPNLPGPWRQTNEPFFRIKPCLETRLTFASLEPLIDFLANLEPELWPKKPIFHKNKKLQETCDFPSNG